MSLCHKEYIKTILRNIYSEMFGQTLCGMFIFSRHSLPALDLEHLRSLLGVFPQFRMPSLRPLRRQFGYGKRVPIIRSARLASARAQMEGYYYSAEKKIVALPSGRSFPDRKTIAAATRNERRRRWRSDRKTEHKI